MASLSKQYDHQKLFGQVYTPRWVVEKMLADMGFDTPTILGKTILDPACGDGRFLTAVAEKIIAFSSEEDLVKNLEKIYGWDIDRQALDCCLENLNNLIKPFPIQVNWNIGFGNSLRKIAESDSQKFDFIVGNPPYIRIQHLEENERKFVQKAYKFCKNGSTDTYIAFYELCDFLLEKNGICGLISPNTFLYSETAKQMRAYFAEKQSLIKITNYAAIQLFNKASTYSAIMIFGKKAADFFMFEQAKTASEFEARKIHFQEIRKQKIWQLSVQKNDQNFQEQTHKVKLKEICHIHVGITTLCDKAYIFSIQNLENEPQYVWANTPLKGGIKIEKAILKPIIKASKLKNATDEIVQYILFPYEKVNEKHKIIPENRLKNDFPFAYEYLLGVKPELDKRDNGKINAVAWYAFGRSQGLDTSFGKKILFSPMNQKPNFIFIENKECTFYSGYCIKYEGDYQFLLEQLNSAQLADFIAVSSRDFRGGWKAYNKKVLEEFEISKPQNQTTNSFVYLTSI